MDNMARMRYMPTRRINREMLAPHHPSQMRIKNFSLPANVVARSRQH